MLTLAKEKTHFEDVLGFNPLASSNALYALCDYETLIKKELNLNDFIKLAIKHKVTLVQYRDKVSSLETQKKNLLILKKELNIPIIINDKLELINYCDGIHLGQEDLLKLNQNKIIALKLLRIKVKNKLIGISTHNEQEILEANSFDIDMIGLGAYKPTNTKEIDNIIGDKISYLAKISKHPVCVIGGVKIKDKILNANFNVVGSDLYE